MFIVNPADKDGINSKNVQSNPRTQLTDHDSGRRADILIRSNQRTEARSGFAAPSSGLSCCGQECRQECPRSAFTPVVTKLKGLRSSWVRASQAIQMRLVYFLAISILVRVNFCFPSTSVTVPLATTFLAPWQTSSVNALLTSLFTK
jgi:hypothetical protein